MWSKSSEFITGNYLDLNYSLFRPERFNKEIDVYVKTITLLNKELIKLNKILNM